ncbi:MAG TPA: VOC family protein [Allosphingosinicella sp.]|nr:VOC family protein [Allosphingosinicella sp.]
MSLLFRLLAAALLTAASSAFAAASAAPGSHILGRGVDHVLLWTRDAGRASRVLERQLGFQVRPGGDFGDGVANRIVQFSDMSYLELLFFTVPMDQIAPDVMEGVQFLRERDGSNGFGINVPSLESTVAHLTSAGFAMGEPTAGSYDPDGPEGPRPREASLYRTAGFSRQPIPGLDPFFVWYRPYASWSLTEHRMREARARHPNTAQRLTGVWIAVADAALTASILQRMGIVPGRLISLPHLQALASPFVAGRSTVLLVTATGEGYAARQIRSRGSHVLGVSIDVDSVDVAAAAVARGYGRRPHRYRGPFGDSVLARSEADLGLLVEFHR